MSCRSLRVSSTVLLAAADATDAQPSAPGPSPSAVGPRASAARRRRSSPSRARSPSSPLRAQPRLHLAAGRRLGERASVNLDFSYSKAGLTGHGESSSVTINPGTTLYDIRLLASYDLVRLGQDARVAIAAGPMLQRWSGEAVVDSHAEWGGAAALTLLTPISGPFGLLVTGSLAVAGSPLDTANLQELNETFETVAIWTRELAVGLRYSF